MGLVGLLTVGGTAATTPLDQHPAYTPLVEGWRSRMDLFDVPGTAIAVVKGDTIWTETAGIRNEAGDPVTADTIFYIASITKTYVATLAALLAEEGTLALDAPVQSYLPRFELADEDRTRSVTVLDLLAHRPGIQSGEIVLLDAYSGEITEDRYYHWLSRATSDGETRYSNVHFTIAGRVIESVTGIDWRDALDARLFTPAGLTRTTGYASEMYGDEDSATPLERDGESWRPVSQRKTDRTMHAAGGLGTTVADLARYLQLHINQGELDGVRLFSAQTADEIQREHSTHDPNGSLRIMQGFGLGWQRGTFNGVGFLAHGGGYDGASAYVAFFPEQRTGLAILVNAGSFARGWGSAVAVDVFEAITSTEAEWKPWDRYARQIAEIRAEEAAAGEGQDGVAVDGAPGSEGASTPDQPESHSPTAELSRPVGLYTGAFRHEWLGTLHVTRTGDELILHLGDRPVSHTALGVDERTLDDLFDPPARLTFLVGEHGRVDRVRVADEDLGDLIFER
jgi:CubicO group peptidase (beta-lactamase class C family)